MSKTAVVMSKYEIKEQRMKKLYTILPVLSVLLLIALWFVASGGSNAAFPSPAET